MTSGLYGPLPSPLATQPSCTGPSCSCPQGSSHTAICVSSGATNRCKPQQNTGLPAPGLLAMQPRVSPPQNVHPHMAPSTLAPFSWLHKGLLLPPSNGGGEVLPLAASSPCLLWPPKPLTQGPKLQPALSKPRLHMPQCPHSGAHSTGRVSPLLRNHCWQGTAAQPGGSVAGGFTPCSHSAQHAAFPRDVTSSTSW